MPFLRVCASQILNPRAVRSKSLLHRKLWVPHGLLWDFVTISQRLPEKSQVMVVGAVLECNVSFFVMRFEMD